MDGYSLRYSKPFPLCSTDIICSLLHRPEYERDWSLAVYLACKNGDRQLFRLVRRFGHNPIAAHYYACYGGSLEIIHQTVYPFIRYHYTERKYITLDEAELQVDQGLIESNTADALFYACYGGHQQAVEYLLKCEPCLNMTTRRLLNTKLRGFARGCHYEKFVDEANNTSQEARQGIEWPGCYYHACAGGCRSLVEYISEQCPNLNWGNGFIRACEYGHIQLARWICCTHQLSNIDIYSGYAAAVANRRIDVARWLFPVTRDIPETRTRVNADFMRVGIYHIDAQSVSIGDINDFLQPASLFRQVGDLVACDTTPLRWNVLLDVACEKGMWCLAHYAMENIEMEPIIYHGAFVRAYEYARKNNMTSVGKMSAYHDHEARRFAELFAGQARTRCAWLCSLCWLWWCW